MKYLVSSIFYGFRDLFFEPNQNLIRNGYHIIENFLSEESCDRIVENISFKVTNGEISWKDGESSDYRILGYDYQDHSLLKSTDKLVEEQFEQYIGSCNSLKYFRMANVVFHRKGNKGSGGGWHRDSLNRRQLKLMIYLVDVNDANGPFEYKKSSHKLYHKLRFNMFRKSVRFNERSSVLKPESDVLVGKKGTAIIFDSSGVHRGRPIMSGERYALTYYTFARAIPDHLQRLIDVLSNDE